MSDIYLVADVADLGTPCYRTEQERYVDYMTRTTWRLPLGIAGVIVSPSEPSVEDRDKMWFREGDDGGLSVAVPFVYSVDYARWVARHPMQRGDGYASMIWKGTAAQLLTYDGGSNAAVTPVTGPMWEADTDFEDVWPIGVDAAGVVTVPGIAGVTNVFDDATPGLPAAIGVYFIRRTARIYYTT